MTQDVQAGRLHLDASVDTTGLARTTQRKIDAEMAKVRAKIRAEVDTRALATQAKSAATAASRDVRMKIRADLDAKSLRDQVRAAIATVQNEAHVSIHVEVGRASLDKAKADLASVTGTHKAKIDVEPQLAAARAEIEAWRREAERTVRPNVNPNTPTPVPGGAGGGGGGGVPAGLKEAGDAISKLSTIPAIAGGILAAASAVTQLGGALFAMGSAASQAVVGLAAIPNLIGMAGMGIGALIIGFSGMGDALGALSQQEQQGATQAKQLGRSQEAAAQAVASAQQALANARHQAADSARAAANAIEDAEWSLARAQEAAHDAQVNLNEARQQARDRIRDLNRELRLSAGDEKAALDAVIRAKEELQDVKWDASSSEREKRAAEARLAQAEGDYKRFKANQSDLRKDAKEANKEGVEGSDEVIQAKRALRDANHGVQESEQALAEARHSAADSARQNAQAVAAARQALANAQKASSDAMKQQTTSQIALSNAYEKLGPAARRFAEYIYSLKPRWKEFREAVQQSLLPPIQRGIKAALPLLDTLQGGMVRTAQIIGNSFERTGKKIGSGAFRKDVKKIMGSNNRALKDFMISGENLIDVLRNIAVVAGPTLVEPFAKWIRTVTKAWKAMSQTGRETGTMRERFIKVRETIALLGKILGNLGKAFYNMGKAGSDAGKGMLTDLSDAIAEWAKWTGSPEGQKRLKEFFANTKAAAGAVGRLIVSLTKLIAKAGQSGNGPFVTFINALTTISDVLGKAFGSKTGGAILGWGIGAAGAVGVLGKALSPVIGFVGGLKDAWDGMMGAIDKGKQAWDIMKTGLEKAKTVMTALKNSTLGTRIQLGLLWVQEKLVALWARVVAGATAAWAAVQRVLNAAWAMSPIGVVVVALLAIGAALVFAYKKFKWFHDFVNWVWEHLVAGAKWLWDVLFGHSIFPDLVKGMQWVGDMIGKVFSAIWTGIKWLGKAFSWLWDNAVKPAWDLISKAIGLVWNYYYKPILKLIWNAIKLVGRVFRWLYVKAVQPAWKAIRKAIAVAWRVLKGIFRLLVRAIRGVGVIAKWLWNNAIKPAWGAIRKAIVTGWKIIKPILAFFWKGLKTIGRWFEWLWNNAIRPAWNKIKDAISWGWKHVLKPAFDKLMSVVKKDIPDAFTKAKNGIKDVWDKIKEIAAAPIRFVVNTVYSKGIRPVVNAIPGVPNLPELHFAKGGVMPGFTPGRDPHHFVNPSTGQRLDVSGGEAWMRPEWTRVVGPKAVHAMNAAAAKGKNALRNLLSGGQVPERLEHAKGGILSRLANLPERMRFWLGGIMPLAGATVSKHDTSSGTYKGFPFAGDLNYPGRADYGKPIVAWKSGVAAPFDLGSDRSYGRGQVINTTGGGSQLYAHMSKVITALAGKMVRAGQTIGYVGDYGNTGNPPTSHLHFEVRSGAVNLGDTSGGGVAPSPEEQRRAAAKAKGKKKEASWLSAIGKAKDLLTKIPDMVSRLGNMKGWGSMMMDSVKHMGGKVIQWLNDKIPDSIPIPGPDIPLPKNPIPNVFDSGGALYPGSTLAINRTGKVETVFTNEQITRTSESLARMTRDLVDAREHRKGAAALVEHLHLTVGDRDDVQPALRTTNKELRKIQLGGVHANRPV